MNSNPLRTMTLSHVAAGFTLLEILLVVLIVSIMTAVGVNTINSQSIERVIMNQAQKFENDLQFICDKAVFENQAFGFEWTMSGYQVLRYQQQTWQPVEAQVDAAIPTTIQVDLLIDGLSQILPEEGEALPHIVCQSDGSFNAFELRFSAQQAATPAHYYALNTESPWRLTGGWHQP